MNNSSELSFPTPYPGEFFGGLVLRFWELYGSGIPRHYLYETLRIRASDITSIPTGLVQLEKVIPKVWEKGIVSMLENHTAWPFYRPFLTRRTAARAWKRITDGPKGSMQLTLGDAASRLHIRRGLRLCTHCAADDRDAVGRSYFHVEHQLPGITCCPKHGIELKQTQGIWQTAINPNVLLATNSSIGGDKASSGEIRLSTLASSLLSAKLPIIDPENFFITYMERLRSLSLVTRHGRVRYRPLTSQIEKTFSKELLMRIAGNGDEVQNWVHSILFKPSLSHHPIKHLIIIGALYGTVDAFQAGMEQMELRFNAVPEPAPERDIADEINRAFNGREKSVTEVAKEIGLSVTTCTIYAKRLGIKVNVRPKALTQKVAAKIRQLAADGQSANAIAKSVSTSLTSVYRVIRSVPSTERAWRQGRETILRNKHRSIWTRQIRSLPPRGVSVIRERLPASYAWLYRHDRKWLKKHMPSKSNVSA